MKDRFYNKQFNPPPRPDPSTGHLGLRRIKNYVMRRRGLRNHFVWLLKVFPDAPITERYLIRVNSVDEIQDIIIPEWELRPYCSPVVVGVSDAGPARPDEIIPEPVEDTRDELEKMIDSRLKTIERRFEAEQKREARKEKKMTKIRNKRSTNKKKVV